MANQKRDLLAILKRELGFLESGGYASDRKNPWRPPFVFEDSPSCPNSHLAVPATPCSECELIALVPPEQRHKDRPCRLIPITDEGQTVQDFYASGTQRELEWSFMVWLRKLVGRMDRERHKVGDKRLPARIFDPGRLFPRIVRKRN
jgi:hypothetical protein